MYHGTQLSGDYHRKCNEENWTKFYIDYTASIIYCYSSLAIITTTTTTTTTTVQA